MAVRNCDQRTGRPIPRQTDGNAVGIIFQLAPHDRSRGNQPPQRSGDGCGRLVDPLHLRDHIGRIHRGADTTPVSSDCSYQFSHNISQILIFLVCGQDKPPAGYPPAQGRTYPRHTPRAAHIPPLPASRKAGHGNRPVQKNALPPGNKRPHPARTGRSRSPYAGPDWSYSARHSIPRQSHRQRCCPPGFPDACTRCSRRTQTARPEP